MVDLQLIALSMTQVTVDAHCSPCWPARRAKWQLTPTCHTPAALAVDASDYFLHGSKKITGRSMCEFASPRYSGLQQNVCSVGFLLHHMVQW